MRNMIEEPDSIKYAEFGSGADSGTHTIPDFYIMFEQLQLNDIASAKVCGLPCSSLHMLECLGKDPSTWKVGKGEDMLSPCGMGRRLRGGSGGVHCR